MILAGRLLLVVAVAALGICPLTAASTITYTLTSSALGPILLGYDPLGFNGQSATVTAVASTLLQPVSTSKNGVMYALPSGSFTLVIGGTSYATFGSTIGITVSKTHPDLMNFYTHITVGGITVPIQCTIVLAKHSFTRSIFKHPTTFTPAMQTLTGSTSSGAGNRFFEVYPHMSTVMGLGGSISSAAN